MIEISINGEIRALEGEMTLSQMLERLGYQRDQGFAVAVNMVFVAIDKYDTTTIKEGDAIDILAPVQGG